MCRPKLRMRYRMSVIYGHPVMAATRALRFSDHVTKRNEGSGDENVPPLQRSHMRRRLTAVLVSTGAMSASCLRKCSSVSIITFFCWGKDINNKHRSACVDFAYSYCTSEKQA